MIVYISNNILESHTEGAQVIGMKVQQKIANKVQGKPKLIMRNTEDITNIRKPDSRWHPFLNGIIKCKYSVLHHYQYGKGSPGPGLPAPWPLSHNTSHTPVHTRRNRKTATHGPSNPWVTPHPFDPIQTWIQQFYLNKTYPTWPVHSSMHPEMNQNTSLVRTDQEWDNQYQDNPHPKRLRWKLYQGLRVRTQFMASDFLT